MDLRLSAIMLFRRIKMRVLGKKPVIKGECLQCGGCCRKLNLFIDDRWVASREEFAGLQKRCPELRRFEPVGVNENGYLQFRCTLLSDEGWCLDYENRLDFCREHPAPSLYEDGASVPVSCGFRIELVKDFAPYLDKKK